MTLLDTPRTADRAALSTRDLAVVLNPVKVESGKILLDPEG